VAYAVFAIEVDPAPKFQLGTYLRMGLSDEEAADPTAIEIMRSEYTAWAVGHGLADIAEAIASYLDRVCQAFGGRLGYAGPFRQFERLGVDKKLAALPKITLPQIGIDAVQTVVLARNCLVHRHGFVGEADCNSGRELNLRWLGPKLTHMLPTGEVDYDLDYRGPARLPGGSPFRLTTVEIQRSFPLEPAGSQADRPLHVFLVPAGSAEGAVDRGQAHLLSFIECHARLQRNGLTRWPTRSRT
jgi:hypothetical protein